MQRSRRASHRAEAANHASAQISHSPRRTSRESRTFGAGGYRHRGAVGLTSESPRAPRILRHFSLPIISANFVFGERKPHLSLPHQLVASSQEREDPRRNPCAAVPARGAARRFACWFSSRASSKIDLFTSMGLINTISAFPCFIGEAWRSGRDGALPVLAPSSRNRPSTPVTPRQKLVRRRHGTAR